MNLIYLTSKRYPSTTADHFFVKSMALAFTKILGQNFSLFISGSIPNELESINTVSINAPKKFRSVFYFFWLPFFISQKNHNNKETIFFSNDSYLLPILIFWKKLFNFKYIVCSDWHQLFGDWRDKYISKNSDFLISTSENLKKLIIKLSDVSGDKILVSYGGVDLNKFENITEPKESLRKKLNLPQSDFLVGYVGFYKTMGMGKGIDIMLSALSLISDKTVKMVFVGGRDGEVEEYRCLAETLGVSDRSIFIPAVPVDSVPAFESAMDILVIPYPNKPHFRDFGFPMKVYEYMASGRPIIYSKLPIMDEVLSDCAISFDPDDPNDLALKISDVFKNPENNSGQKTLDKVKNFTWQARAERILRFI